MWGKRKENGVWHVQPGAGGQPRKSRWALRWRGHDALFIAAGTWRLQLMKPRWMP